MNDTEHTCPNARPWHQAPLEGKDIHKGCACCSTACQLAPMDMIIAVGFGIATATKDEQIVYSEPHDAESEDDYMTVEQLEALAAADPEHDWRIVKHGPMHGETFQRQGPGKWVCIESNEGFA